VNRSPQPSLVGKAFTAAAGLFRRLQLGEVLVEEYYQFIARTAHRQRDPSSLAVEMYVSKRWPNKFTVG